MCLIIHRDLNGKRGSNVPNAVLDHNARSNPDGFGIAWRDGKKLRHEKFDAGKKAFEDFRSLLKRIDRDPGTEYVAHFRKATHGPVCKALSHPFSYEDPEEGEVLVFHNGIINIDTEPGESDTSAFVKRVLSRIAPRWWESNAYRFLVEESIGWSRLLVMTRRASVRINEESWVKRDGIWYSTNPLPSYGTGTSYTRPGISTGGTIMRPVTTPWRGDEEDEEDEDVAPLPAGTTQSATGWYQNGHHITPLTSERDVDGDRYGTATCDVCRTIGEFFVIGGKVFIDVAHGYAVEEEDDPTIPQEPKRAASCPVALLN